MELFSTSDVNLLTANAGAMRCAEYIYRYAPKDEQFRLCIDMDGVLGHWRGDKEAYRSRVYGDTHFHMSHLYTEGYFVDLPENEIMVAQAKKLAREAEAHGCVVSIFSSFLTDSRYALTEKNLWCDRHIPEIKERIFTPCGIPKAYQIDPMNNGWMLLDDLTENLFDFREAGGTGVKVLNGINDTHKSWTGARIDMNDPELVSKVWAMVDVLQMGAKCI